MHRQELRVALGSFTGKEFSAACDYETQPVYFGIGRTWLALGNRSQTPGELCNQHGHLQDAYVLTEGSSLGAPSRVVNFPASLLLSSTAY